MAGKVIRAEYRQHTVRTMAQRRGTIDKFAFLFAGSGMVSLNRDGNLIDHRRHFRRRLPARFTGFTRDDLREIGFMRLQQDGKFLYDSLPCRKGCLAQRGNAARAA